MKKKINWQKEFIENGRFNDKFSKNLLDHGANILCKVSILGICIPDGEISEG